jgi:hypothetical protein
MEKLLEDLPFEEVVFSLEDADIVPLSLQPR